MNPIKIFRSRLPQPNGRIPLDIIKEDGPFGIAKLPDGTFITFFKPSPRRMSVLARYEDLADAQQWLDVMVRNN